MKPLKPLKFAGLCFCLLGLLPMVGDSAAVQAQSVYAEDMATTPAVQVLRGKEILGELTIDWTLYGESMPRLQAQAEALKDLWQRQWQVLASAPTSGQPVEALKPLVTALQQACEHTQGALNPLDLPLREAWGFTPQSLSYQVPEAGERQRLTAQVQAQGCQGIRETQPLSREYFAAGWLIDQSKALLSAPAVRAARVQMGPVAYYAGVPPQAPAWKVPVYHPRKEDQLIQYFYLKDQSLVMLRDATSHFYANGLRYPDFVDARTGLVHSESAGAYVLGSSALAAQLLARGVVLLTAEQIKPWMQQQPEKTQVIRWRERLEQLTPEEFRSP